MKYFFPKSSDFMQFSITPLDLLNLLQKDRGIVKLHLLSPVHFFLAMDYFSVYMHLLSPVHFFWPWIIFLFYFSVYKIFASSVYALFDC